jgi:hypothetical protein
LFVGRHHLVRNGPCTTMHKHHRTPFGLRSPTFVAWKRGIGNHVRASLFSHPCIQNEEGLTGDDQEQERTTA